jgi:hypothetical protein
MSESTTPVPAEAIEAAIAAYKGVTALAYVDDRNAGMRAALAAAVPVLLATERERIATAIEAVRDDRYNQWRDVGLNLAASIARTTTEDTETVTYDGYGAPIVHDPQDDGHA